MNLTKYSISNHTVFPLTDTSDTYFTLTLIRGRALFQEERKKFISDFKTLPFPFSKEKAKLPIQYLPLYISELQVISIL